MKIYCGRDRTDDGFTSKHQSGAGSQQPAFRKRYNIYLDNWYSSPGLFVQLLQAETNVCGTVRLNRNEMPPDFSKKKLERGEIAFYSSTDELLALK